MENKQKMPKIPGNGLKEPDGQGQGSGWDLDLALAYCSLVHSTVMYRAHRTIIMVELVGQN